MQTVDYEKSDLKKTLDKITILKKVSFHLKYQTSYGQVIYVYGDHPLLGNNDVAHAIPLTFLNQSYWSLNLDFSDYQLFDKITYHYFILNPDGTKIFDWGNDKVFNPNKVNTSTLVLMDSWNYTGYIENVFYTEPFTKVLLKPIAKQKPSNGILKNTTHIFRVKAPLIQAHQTLCMVGASKELGNWNVSNPILLTKIMEAPYFEVSLDLGKASFPFEYKFGVFDISKKEFVCFENGENRILSDAIIKNQLTIINDGFAQLSNTSWKGAGVAIPVFSLRSSQSAGIGEFADLKYLVDWSKKIGLKLIQLLPLNDTTATHTWLDSYPYAAISAFALHPMFLRLQDVLKKDQLSLLEPFQEQINQLNALTEIDYDGVMQLKWKFLKLIYAENGKKDLASVGFKKFFKQNEHWLVSYSAFSYLRDLHGTVDFNTWPTHAKFDQKEVDQLTNAKSNKYHEIAFYYFVQYHLHVQLSASTQYAHENGVVVKGDIPIGVYRYGADAWQHPDLFHMDMQAGAPPDDFAVKGQNWGFPTYNWEVMASDDYSWWKLRFEQMSFYFDAFRIDHILGFFRIWSIPTDQVEGIMGRFVPAIPIAQNELDKKGISNDMDRFTQPFINEAVLFTYFGYDNEYAKQHFVKAKGEGRYELLPIFTTQKSVENYFQKLPNDDWHCKMQQGLFNLISNIILFKGDDEQTYHFRFNMEGTLSFQNLDEKSKHALRDLYVNYFFVRQDNAWEKEALNKLPMLKKSTNMLICGEDLGLVPNCVPHVMHQLGMLSLEVQRMPKASNKTFFHPNDAPYLSVVTPSSHDTSTIRGWWEEDKNKTQQFFNNEIGQMGEAPNYCEPWINKAILNQHLYSPAMWAIFQLQDFLGIDASIRRTNPKEEQINVPANPKHYWRYRMHMPLEILLNEDSLNEQLHHMILSSGRY
jgi:4-alpha-glucanotransferase